MGTYGVDPTTGELYPMEQPPRDLPACPVAPPPQSPQMPVERFSGPGAAQEPLEPVAPQESPATPRNDLPVGLEVPEMDIRQFLLAAAVQGYRVCALEDCRNLFLPTRPQQVYCTRSHAKKAENARRKAKREGP